MLDKLLDDLRFPIGLLFMIFGLILLVLGITQPAGANADMNLNLFSGAVMGLFALFMLATSVMAAKKCPDNGEAHKQ